MLPQFYPGVETSVKRILNKIEIELSYTGTKKSKK